MTLQRTDKLKYWLIDWLINIWLMTSRWSLHQERMMFNSQWLFYPAAAAQDFYFSRTMSRSRDRGENCINKATFSAIWLAAYCGWICFHLLIAFDVAFVWIDCFWNGWLVLSIKVALAQACNTISCRNCLEIQLPRTTFEAFKSGDHHHHHYHYRHHHHRHVFVLLH